MLKSDPSHMQKPTLLCLVELVHTINYQAASASNMGLSQLFNMHMVSMRSYLRRQQLMVGEMFCLQRHSCCMCDCVTPL